MSSWARRGIALAAVALAIAAVYGGSLSSDFVFDDHLLVVDNPAVRLPLREAARLLDPHQPGVTYRPLRIFSYMVDHAIAGGLEPRVFRSTNLILHLLTSLLVLALARRCGVSFPAALAGALLFAVHPLASEAVVYVSGRRDLLCAALSIAALICWRSALLATAGGPIGGPIGDGSGGAIGGARPTAWMVGAGGLAVLALGAKETAVVVPGLAALLATVAPVRLHALWRRSSFLLWAGFAVAALSVLAVLYAPAIGRALAPLAREPLGPQPDLTLTVLARYMGLVVWPSRLLADYRGDALLPGLGETTPWSALLAIVAWIAAGAALTWRGSPAGAGLLWFPVALLPVLQIVPYREVLAEHNAYLALAGPAIASAAAVDAMAGTLRKPARLVALLAVLLVLLGWRTSRRCADWTDDLTLWSRTIEDGGDGFRARYNRGVALLASARLAEARRDLEVAVARDPGSRPATVALALAILRSGDDAAAEATARRALSLGPDASGQAVLGWALLARGDLAGARSAFDAALRLQPGHDEATRGLRVLEGRRREPSPAAPPGR